jgi:hypothetical protein
MPGKVYMTLIIDERVFVGEDGERLPVAVAVDADGEDCDLADAVWCTAGPDRNGLYAQIDMTQKPTVH